MISQGIVPKLLDLLKSSGPGSLDVWAAASGILQMYICDDESMEALQQNKQVLPMFVDGMKSLDGFISRFENAEEPLARESATFIFRIIEYLSQAVWGAAYHVGITRDPGLKLKMLTDLVALSNRSRQQQQVDKWHRWGLEWWHVTYSLVAGIASFAMNEDTTTMMVGTNQEELEKDGPADQMLNMVQVQARLVWEQQDIGPAQVMVAGLTSIVYLTLHPTGTIGEESMKGIYRKRLLKAGMFPVLLECMEAPMVDGVATLFSHKSCAVGIMYLATVAEDEITAPMAMRLLLLIERSTIPEVVEHLMVAFWVLMRNPSLANEIRAFNVNESAAVAQDLFLEDLQAINRLDQSALPSPRQSRVSRSSMPSQAANDDHEGPPGMAEEASLQAEESGVSGATGVTTQAGEEVGEKKNKPAIPSTDPETGPKAQVANRHWGLQVLLHVADHWTDRVENMNEDEVKENMCLLKMLEFMVACFWLYLVGENEIKPRHVNLSGMDAPRGVEKMTWWTVQLPQIIENLEDSPYKKRSINVIMRIMSFQLRAHAKCVQLAAGALWNMCMRSRAVEIKVMELQVIDLLLDIICDDMWPPPTRDTAAAFLGELCEDWDNVRQIGEKGMADVHMGLLGLVETRVPRLQASALRVLGHMTFQTPNMCPNPKLTMMQTKSNFMENGGIAIITKMISHYLKKLLLSTDGYGVDEVDIEVDIDALPEAEVGKLPLIAHGLRVLLNISVCEQFQVQLAKQSLMTMLRINVLFNKLMEKGSILPLERDVANLTNGIISNLSQHPNNRTRFYKLELSGTAIASNSMETETLPELKNPYGRMGLKNSSRLQSRGRLGSRNQSSVTKSLTSIPTKKASVGKVEGSSPRNQKPESMPNLTARLSTKNRSPPVQRPKVIFPPLPKAVIHSAVCKDPAGTTDMFTWPGMSAAEAAAASKQSILEEEEQFANIDRLKNQSKRDFLHWMHSTFTDPETERALQRVVGKTPKSVRNLLPIKLDVDVPDASERVGPKEWEESSKGTLNNYLQQMRKPRSHLWRTPDEFNAVTGQRRWEPAVSEYVNARDAELPEIAEKLLLTNDPQYAKGDLAEAALKLKESSHVDYCPLAEGDQPVSLPESVSLRRPPTRGEVLEGGRANGQLSMVTFSEHQLAPEEQEDGTVIVKPLHLGVKLAPHRPRTYMTFFTDQLFRETNRTRAKLVMFEKVEGSRVHEGNIPHYQLPNGKQAHYYFTSAMVDEVDVKLRTPPIRPNTLQAALQHTIPLDTELSEVAKPPGNGPEIKPFKPAPPLAPLPTKHILKVWDPQSLERSAFGNLEADKIEFMLACEKETRKETRVTREKLRIKTPWTLPISIFKPRAKESDARAYYDDDALKTKMFNFDWERLEQKEKFTSMLHRENNHHPEQISNEEAVKRVKGIVEHHYHSIQSAFEYYASMGSGSAFHIPLNSFTAFLDDCNIPDPESGSCKRSDCDTIFIAANYTAEKTGKFHAVNDEHALMRFEFIEMLIRVALAKYGKDIECFNPVESMKRLFNENVLPNIPPLALIDVNQFRKDRLYKEPVDLVFKSNSAVLKSIYSRFRLPPKGGGLRKKLMYMDGWMLLMETVGLVDDQFTLPDARKCYLWSRMRVAKEIDDFDRYTALTFVDFLEALARMADMKMIPTKKELDAAGFEDRYAWMQAERSSPQPVIPRRESAYIGASSKRPLHEKLEGLLEIVFRGLWFDGNSSGLDFNLGSLPGYMAKIDKSLGP